MNGNAWAYSTHMLRRVMKVVNYFTVGLTLAIFDITPVQVPDKVEEMNPKDINFNVNVEFADSMDQSCPGEIHAKGFPADDPEAKREYEKAAKDFCIDNLSAFNK